MSDSFFSRWSRQKSLKRDLAQAREVASPAQSGAATPLVPVPKTDNETTVASQQALPDLPTQADVDSLVVGADVSRFLQNGVAEAVRGAALKKLFADPAYNVISEMDDYVEDYSQMVKLSATELRRLQQSKDLHLFEDPPWKIEADARDAAANRAAEEQAAGREAESAGNASGDVSPEANDAVPNAEAAAPTTDSASDIEEPKTNL